MKWILIICLFFSLGIDLSGQRSNPFEIKDRLDSIYTSDNTRVNDDQGAIDIGATQETPTTTTEVSSENNSLRKEEDNIASGENPFEVDHVPIRKSQLKEKSAIKEEPAYPSITKKDIQVKKANNLTTFIVSILSLLLIAIVANTRRSLLLKIFKSFTNDNFLKLTQREENGGMHGAFIILYILFVLSMVTFLYLIIPYFTGQAIGWFFLLLLVVGTYFFRHLFMYLFSQIFPVERDVKQYNFTIAIFNLLIGLILIPLNLIIAYATDYLSVAAIYTSLFILAFIYLIRNFKGLLLGMISASRSLLHFLLYICTFELVPILMLIKFLGG